MTYVVMRMTPGEAEFHHPLSQELVLRATPYIKEQLDNVLMDHDDTGTRFHDLRRVHEPLRSSSWIVKFKDNSLIITNQISGEDANQFGYLYFGNGSAPICAAHMTRRLRRGWSSRDGHRSEVLGGKKPVPGTYGPEYPGMLKFYDKRNGMWQYRRCVNPISTSIVEDFSSDIRNAVFHGLEMARYEMYDRFDRDTMGVNEPEDAGMSDPATLEEISYIEESKTKSEQDLIDYRVKKLQEEQVTMDSQITDRTVQEKARGILVKAGLEQPKNQEAKKVKESFWNTFKARVEEVTETVSDKVHKFFGVTR